MPISHSAGHLKEKEKFDFSYFVKLLFDQNKHSLNLYGLGLYFPPPLSSSIRYSPTPYPHLPPSTAEISEDEW
jgi:hypothetical protein